MKLAPNKPLERTVTRLQALTGGILVPAAQRHVMHRREMKHMGAKIIMGDLGLAYRTITVLDQYTEMEV
jgi:hypothetical protein